MKTLLSILLALFIGLAPLAGKSQSKEKKVLEGMVLFEPSMGVQTQLKATATTAVDRESYKIQFVLMWYAAVLHHLGTSDTASKLKDEVQRAIQSIATEKGMYRANLLTKSQFIKDAQTKGVKKIMGSLLMIEGEGSSLNFPIQAEEIETFGPASCIAIINEGTQSLTENGLRMMVLALGGMNKWYREMGKNTDLQSMVKAPAYGLSLAADIVQKLAGSKILKTE